MNKLKRYFNAVIKQAFQKDGAENQDMNAITAKEKQSIFIKSYLKPVLKQQGYLINGRTWSRDQGDFFIIVNLQNFSWNTKNDVTFCFNIGIGLKSLMKDPSELPKYADLTIFVRDVAYLSDSRKSSMYKNQTGYIMQEDTSIDNFIEEFKIDFEGHLFPTLAKLVTLNDCVEYYQRFPFWGDRLKQIITTENR